MPAFLKLPENDKERKTSIIFLIIGIFLLIISLVIGIPKNTTGSTIFFLSVVSFMLVYIHAWKKISKFQILTIASIISLFFFIMAHNIFAGTAEVSEGIPFLQKIIEALDIIFFYIAVFVCPAAALLGLGGLFLFFIRRMSNKN